MELPSNEKRETRYADYVTDRNYLGSPSIKSSRDLKGSN